MAALYLLAGLLGFVFLNILLLGICALLVDPEKEYEKTAVFTASFWTAQRQQR